MTCAADREVVPGRNASVGHPAGGNVGGCGFLGLAEQCLVRGGACGWSAGFAERDHDYLTGLLDHGTSGLMRLRCGFSPRLGGVESEAESGLHGPASPIYSKYVAEVVEP